MKQTSLQQPTRQDDALLRSILLKLTAAQKILCTVVIAAVALIWYDLLNRLIAFGQHIDYSGLRVLGVQAIELVKLYNPFFWWAVVALCTLIIAYFLYTFVKNTQRTAHGKFVSTDVISELVDQFSDPANEVLRWVWQDRRNPITVGDLQQLSREMRTGRAHKIALAREHAAAVDEAAVAPRRNDPLQSH
ncbi:MAG TPA: hypothetical protein VIR04_06585 [Paralcaligenes sp.]|jgi:hypothetical protein